MRFAGSLILAVIAMSACNREKPADDPTRFGKSEILHPATTSSIGGSNWPSDLPAYVAPYPGTEAVTMFSGRDGKQMAGMISFMTTDSPEKVIGFYKARATAAKLGNEVTMNTAEVKTYMVSDEPTHRSLSVQASIQEGRTQVALTYGMTG